VKRTATSVMKLKNVLSEVQTTAPRVFRKVRMRERIVKRVKHVGDDRIEQRQSRRSALLEVSKNELRAGREK